MAAPIDSGIDSSRTETVNDPAGHMIEFGVPADHRVYEVYFTLRKQAKGDASVQTCPKCHNQVLALHTAAEKPILERHPIETLLKRLAFGYYEMLPVVAFLFGVAVLTLPIDLVTALRGLEPWKGYSLHSALFLAGAMLLDTWFLGKVRRTIHNLQPLITKSDGKVLMFVHRMMVDWKLFVLVAVISMGFTMMTSAEEIFANQWIAAQFLEGQAYTAIALGFSAQLVLAYLFLSIALVHTTYTARAGDPLGRDKATERSAKSMAGASYVFALTCGLLSFTGTILYLAFKPVGISSTLAPNMVASLGILLILPTLFALFNYGVERSIHNQVEHPAVAPKPHVVLEVLPAGEFVSVMLTEPDTARRLSDDVPAKPIQQALTNRWKQVQVMCTLLAFRSRGLSSASIVEPEGFDGDVRDDIDGLGDEMAQELLPDRIRFTLERVTDMTEQRPVVIRAEGDEAGLPWEITRIREESLALRVPVVRAPLPGALTYSYPRLRKVLVVACDAEASANWPKLKNVFAKELDDIRRGVRKHFGVDIVSGSGATRERILNRISSGEYDAFHFCGHSHYDPGNSAKSFLLIHGDERLHATDLLEALVTGGLQLVVLNSCYSGRLEETGEAEARGLAGVFIRRGVPNVVAMQFAVSDQAASRIPSIMYGALAAGKSVEVAVMKCRQELHRLNPGDPSWASLIHFRSAAPRSEAHASSHESFS